MDQNILTQVTLTYRQLRGENICVIEGKDLHLTKNEIVQVCEMIKEWKPETRTDAIQLKFQHNDLDCDAIETLVQYILQEKRFSVRTLHLDHNKIGDRGCKSIAELLKIKGPFYEIHLSHNKITSEGALPLIQSIGQSSFYPIYQGPQWMPLWLRLEFNFIDDHQLIQYMEDNKVGYCRALTYNKKAFNCCPFFCTMKQPRKVHIFCVHIQQVTLNDLTKKLTKEKASDKDSMDRDLLLFLDTNAVLRMMIPVKGIDKSNLKIRMFDFASVFNFQNLLEKSRLGKLAGIKVVIVNTVHYELDGIKSRYKSDLCITKMFRKWALQISDELSSKWLVILGAHEGEQIVRNAKDRIIDTDTIEVLNSRNDATLLNIVGFYNKKFYDYEKGVGFTCLLTDDKNMISDANRYNIPVEPLNQLDKKLKNYEKWTASTVRKCMQEAVTVPAPLTSMEELTDESTTLLSTANSLLDSCKVTDETLKSLNELKKNSQVNEFLAKFDELMVKVVEREASLNKALSDISAWKTKQNMKDSQLESSTLGDSTNKKNSQSLPLKNGTPIKTPNGKKNKKNKRPQSTPSTPLSKSTDKIPDKSSDTAQLESIFETLSIGTSKKNKDKPLKQSNGGSGQIPPAQNNKDDKTSKKKKKIQTAKQGSDDDKLFSILDVADLESEVTIKTNMRELVDSIKEL